MADDTTPGERLRALVKDFSTAMLITHAEPNRLHARPMALARSTETEDVLYFATDIESAKVSEILANPRVYAILQDRSRYVFLAGTVSLSKERSLVARLWSEAWRVWFPEGKDDPALCLLVFEPEEGEYWDESGMNGLKYLFKAAKAYAAGERPALDAQRHGKASF
jgi:general stress protein 26